MASQSFEIWNSCVVYVHLFFVFKSTENNKSIDFLEIWCYEDPAPTLLWDGYENITLDNVVVIDKVVMIGRSNIGRKPLYMGWSSGRVVCARASVKTSKMSNMVSVNGCKDPLDNSFTGHSKCVSDASARERHTNKINWRLCAVILSPLQTISCSYCCLWVMYTSHPEISVLNGTFTVR